VSGRISDPAVYARAMAANKERSDRLRRVAQLVADRMMFDDGAREVPAAVVEVFKADMPEIASDVSSGRYTFQLAAIVIGYAGEEMPLVIAEWDGAAEAHRYGKRIRREVERIQRAKFKKPSKKPSKKGAKR
jgi:hypothetical protein